MLLTCIYIITAALRTGVCPHSFKITISVYVQFKQKLRVKYPQKIANTFPMHIRPIIGLTILSQGL